MFDDRSSRQVIKLSMIVFATFGFIVPLLIGIIIYHEITFHISLGTLFILLICAAITSFLNAFIYSIFKKIPPNQKEGIIGGVIGAIAFFVLFTLYYFSLYDEALFKTFTNFIFRSYLLMLIPLSASVVQGVIGGYYIGGRIRSIIGSFLMGFVVFFVMYFIFFTFGGGD